MKSRNLISRTAICLYLVLAVVLLSGCGNDQDKYDGLILTDPNTSKVYLMRHNFNDTYFIDERVIKISGKDTTYVFK